MVGIGFEDGAIEFFGIEQGISEDPFFNNDRKKSRYRGPIVVLGEGVLFLGEDLVESDRGIIDSNHSNTHDNKSNEDGERVFNFEVIFSKFCGDFNSDKDNDIGEVIGDGMHSIGKKSGASGQFSDEISDDHKDEVNESADEGNFLFFSID